jgi:hypothetical protein
MAISADYDLAVAGDHARDGLAEGGISGGDIGATVSHKHTKVVAVPQVQSGIGLVEHIQWSLGP